MSRTPQQPRNKTGTMIDRALREDEILEPSAGFSATVMAEVHRAAEAPAPLPFPWRRLVVAGLAGLVGAVLAWLSVVGVLPSPLETLEAIAGDESLATLLARLAAVLLVTWLASSLPRWLTG
jgi:hypothetical protein